MLFSLQAGSQSPPDSPVISLTRTVTTQSSFLQRTGFPSTCALNLCHPDIHTSTTIELLGHSPGMEKHKNGHIFTMCQQAKADTEGRVYLTLSLQILLKSSRQIQQNNQTVTKIHVSFVLR